MPTDVREIWVFSPETTIFLSINQWNLLSVKIWLVKKQIPFIPSTNVVHYCISFFRVSQSARVSTRAKRARNASPSAQNSTPTLPVPPSQSLIHDAEEVPPFPAVSAGPPKSSAQTTVTQHSSDPPLPLQCCKTYTVLASSPSPPLRIQM